MKNSLAGKSLDIELKKYNDDILIANEADKVRISNKIDSLKLLLN